MSSPPPSSSSSHFLSHFDPLNLEMANSSGDESFSFPSPVKQVKVKRESGLMNPSSSSSSSSVKVLPEEEEEEEDDEVEEQQAGFDTLPSVTRNPSGTISPSHFLELPDFDSRYYLAPFPGEDEPHHPHLPPHGNGLLSRTYSGGTSSSSADLHFPAVPTDGALPASSYSNFMEGRGSGSISPVFLQAGSRGASLRGSISPTRSSSKGSSPRKAQAQGKKRGSTIYCDEELITKLLPMSTKNFNHEIKVLELGDEEVKKLKFARRRIKNARAAQMRRSKVTDSLRDMQVRVDRLNWENSELQRRLNAALEENRLLKQRTSSVMAKGPKLR